MENGKCKQDQIDARKPLRINLRSEVIRLAKSKAASQEVSLWFVIERLLVQWVKGDITLNVGGNNGR